MAGATLRVLVHVPGMRARVQHRFVVVRARL
jgi:hypothetical protein